MSGKHANMENKMSESDRRSGKPERTKRNSRRNTSEVGKSNQRQIEDRLPAHKRETIQKKAINKGLVQKTWQGTLKDEDSLPPNWMEGKIEVLVGIRAVS